jgi:hypothetical protein
MTALQSKRARNLSADDITTLCADKTPESESIEFKREFPHEGIADPWAEKSDFGTYGRTAADCRSRLQVVVRHALR